MSRQSRIPNVKSISQRMTPDSTHTLGQRWQMVVWLDKGWRWQHNVGPTLDQRYISDNYFSPARTDISIVGPMLGQRIQIQL